MANVKLTIDLRGTQFKVNSKKLQKKDGSLLDKVSALAGSKKTTEKLAAEITNQAPAIEHVDINEGTILIEIDHTPQLFHFILDYYTHGNLHFPHDYCATLVARELEFWKLKESVLGPCCWGIYQEQLEKYRLQEEERLKNEEKEHSKFHEKLAHAMASQDISLLKEAIEDFVINNVPEKDGNLRKARDLLHYLETTKELNEAVSSRSLEQLDYAIKKVEKAGFGKTIKEAKKLRDQIKDVHLEKPITKKEDQGEKLRAIEKNRHDILNLDQKTIAEIKSYGKPPEAIHAVMSATFLLLGEAEKSLKDWKAVQTLIGKIGKESLSRKIHEFNIEKVSLETAVKVKHLLEKFSLNEVRDVSAGGGTFYVWSMGVIDEVASR